MPNVRISAVDERTTRVQQVVNGVSELRRPINSVTIQFKLESGGREIKDRLIDSRRLSAFMADGNSYSLRWQSEGGYVWITVTYRIRPASANPFNVDTTDKLKNAALSYMRRRLNEALK